jgi:hypothetical protein
MKILDMCFILRYFVVRYDGENYIMRNFIVCVVPNAIRGDQLKENGMGRTWGR